MDHEEVDQRIQDFNAKFIHRIHFQKVSMKLVTLGRRTIERLPSQIQLHTLLQARHIEDLQGEHGLKCLGVEPKSGEIFDIIIKSKTEKDHYSFECFEWRNLVSKCNIQENDVVSLWLYHEESSTDSLSSSTPPGILLRVDANCKDGEPFPELPIFPKKGPQ